MTRLKKERPKLLFGAGTILSVQHLLQQKNAARSLEFLPGLILNKKYLFSGH
ncbi:MAG: hypothetical protein KAT88_01340 [Spirochaetes bacterium]|nr:hypothetical protein [Spirochaetota bacterium]